MRIKASAGAKRSVTEYVHRLTLVSEPLNTPQGKAEGELLAMLTRLMFVGERQLELFKWLRQGQRG